MYKTSKFATEEEIEELKDLARKAQNTPVIAFSSSHALQGGLSADMDRRLMSRVHEIALTHDLPEIPGHYGIDLKTGEFVSQYEAHKKEGEEDDRIPNPKG